MPVAAVPRYLGSDFANASPALRFGMYLPIWTNRTDQEREVRNRTKKRSREGKKLKQALESDGMDATIRNLVQCERLPELWNKNDQGSRDAWSEVVKLTNVDRECMKALVARETGQFRSMSGGDGLELMAMSVAPFTTGLGNEHPLENGFAFLNPYGLPYLPGSGVKGVVRRAAEELAHRDFFGNDSGWALPTIWHLFGFEPWPVSRDRRKDTEWEEWIEGFSVSRAEIEAYLNAVIDETSTSHRNLKRDILEACDPLRALLQKQQVHVRGALEFRDVIPEIKGNSLMVEIMTPHYSHYYQNKSSNGSTSPHDSGQPNPISFLTVPPDSSFTFHVACNREQLARVAPDIVENDIWKTLLEGAFSHAYEWLGFGAKTAVGYGAMKPDPRAEEAARKRAEEEAESRARQEEERQRQEAEKEEADRRKAEQAAFDALPRSRQRLVEVERALDVFRESRESSRSDSASRNDVKSQANRLADEAPSWSDAAEREEAAVLLERLYEVVGWHEPRKNKKQRARQEKKKRDAIDRIRRGG